MGRYHSFDLFANAKDECGTCGMKMDKPHSCCKDEVKIIKIRDDQNFATVNYTIKNVQAPVMILPDFIALSATPSGKIFDEAGWTPPDIPGKGIYLQNCVFRI